MRGWKNDAAQKREMVGGEAFSSSQLNNLRFLDLNSRGNKNIIKLEPEEKSAESMVRRRRGMVGITVPKGVS